GRTVDRVVAQCHEEIRELVRLGVPAARIVLMPSGVNGTRFTPVGPAAPRLGGRPRVLSVGRLVERKGFADVIRAMRYVPDAECVIVGGPPDAPLDDDPHARALRMIAEECRVADRVRLVGAVPPHAMASWYRSADVLAAAPWYEPFGLTPLEAMSCGVPVVASAVGGLVDTVVDRVTGDLVPARNPRALGLALRRLLADPARRAAYASAALDRARSRYSWSRVADQLAALYSTVAAVAESTEAVA
ncbi:MAG: D-inositol-3-phosphate glycosyltransferase, partial [Micromonosporaceae bacterium]|nr:D-inositol-3-phosphate glycosyltransferase [Micromonosporaceae bacterium]